MWGSLFIGTFWKCSSLSLWLFVTERPALLFFSFFSDFIFAYFSASFRLSYLQLFAHIATSYTEKTANKQWPSLMGGKHWGILFLVIDHQGGHSGFVTHMLMSDSVNLTCLARVGGNQWAWGNLHMGQVLKETVPPAHYPLVHCPSCSSHCPLHCLQKSQKTMGKTYGPFQALLLQLPWILMLEKGRTWV